MKTIAVLGLLLSAFVLSTQGKSPADATGQTVVKISKETTFITEPLDD